MSTEETTTDLKKKAVRGGAISMAARLSTIMIQICSIVVLSRLLAPDDFGIIAMITAITAFMGLFRDMGLSAASIQKGELSDEHTNALFWLNVAAGGLLTLLTMASAPLIAWFYDRPELQPVTLLLATTFVISSIGAQHSALMQRELRFGPKVAGDVAGALLTLVVSITLALFDQGFWSLAWGTVLGAALTTLMYLKGSKFRPSMPKRTGGIRELLGFGANVTAFELVNYFHRNLDSVLIGRVWGAESLGHYSRAYQMMMLPISSLRAPINAIAFPVLSRLQHNPAEFRTFYCRIASLLAFLSMPLMAFLIINSENVVSIALGKQWIAVAPIFALLGITGFIQPVASLRGLVLLSLGQTRLYLAWGIVNAAVVSVAFLIGVSWGPTGVALAYAIANYLILYPSLVYFFRETPLRPLDFFSSIAIPLTATIVAAIGAFISTQYLVMTASNWIQLGSSAAVFLALFLVAVLLLPGGKKTLKDYYTMLRMIKK
ncbi:lipopolysaccharide biosynthesis protein [Stenotrophomonas tumulicola]|uniref:Lipopolysaccharide biosynthesis protein n=1 Tax=Stenotrophomonas tumulicola TaxID=1685415 RepID=A0A7W3FQ44_9GAMM|nr:lipopolysaccharide biosynthesis protein [Stenotrophomonas tumulicola]MBA8683550.1 lipopolysaccharide biosynthesis protein [Stenotrophomonas tumulicola]